MNFSPEPFLYFKNFLKLPDSFFLWHQNFLKGGKSVFGLIRTFWKKQKVFVR